MMSNNIKEEFHNICYHASIGMCSFDDVENWLINNKSSDDILSSEEEACGSARDFTYNVTYVHVHGGATLILNNSKYYITL